MCHHDVVICESVHKKQRTLKIGREWKQGRAVIRTWILIGMPEIALGVRSVVEPPFGDWSTGDRGVEYIGSTQHCERGEIAAE